MQLRRFPSRMLMLATFCACLLTATAAWAEAFALRSSPVTEIPMTLTVGTATPIVVETDYFQNYAQGTALTIVAPEIGRSRPFLGWMAFGVVFSTELTYSFNIGIDFEVTAVYGEPTYILDVTSTPEVGIEFLNEDITPLVTPYQREFEGEEIHDLIIRAPLTHNGRPFGRWVLNGEEYSTFHIAYVTLADSYTLEAQYGSGSMKCKIQPKSARKKARWRIDGGPWMKRGVTATDILVGDHIVEWQPIPGYKTPKTRTVPITDGDEHTIRGRYFPL